nr:VOC family protein [Propionibacterium freudenreichii]
MSQVIIPSLWFDHVARGAVDFYLDVFPDARQTHIAHYPAEGLPDFQQEFAGEVLEIGFSIDGSSSARSTPGRNSRSTRRSRSCSTSTRPPCPTPATGWMPCGRASSTAVRR